MKFRIILLVVTIIGAFSITAFSQNSVCFDIETNPNSDDPALSLFTKYVDVFGIGIYAESSISDEKVKHAAAIFAEWLDNDEDGEADDMDVLNELLSRDALMPIFSSEGSQGENLFFNNYNGNGVGAVLYNNEIIPSRPLTGTQHDATVEENLHTISQIGYANAYPTAFAEGPNSNSLLTIAMDVARGGHFTSIPNPYPESAWYHYDDYTCDYACMATEYFYWGLTSKLGMQEYGNRCEDIAIEWEACTADQFPAMDILLNDLFSNTIYNIPTIAPDGNYCPSSTNVDSALNSSRISIFPNPTQNIIMVHGLHPGETIQILDLAGIVYKSYTCTASNISLDINTLSEGLYIICVGKSKYLNCFQFIKYK